jgi:hypothetical protein
MRHRTLSAIVLGALLLAATLASHEGHHHTALGTVEAIDAEQITLAVIDEGSQAFKLTDATTFMRGEEKASAEDAAVGERAVVVYETKDNVNLAIEVKLPPKDE